MSKRVKLTFELYSIIYACISGFRGVVTLYNKLNYPAEFTWAPNLGEKGTAFSIRPATGMSSSCRLSSLPDFF